jgi:UPF0716 protein FxsA
MRFPARFVFFGYPLAEIVVLWGVASVIGWGWALLGIIAGIPLGFALIRNAGASAAALLQTTSPADNPVVQERTNAIASSMTGQFVAGVLIAIPGYLTDLAGLVMLIPAARNAIGRAIRSRYAPWIARVPGSGPIIQGVVIEDLRYDNPPDTDPPAIGR